MPTVRVWVLGVCVLCLGAAAPKKPEIALGGGAVPGDELGAAPATAPAAQSEFEAFEIRMASLALAAREACAGSPTGNLGAWCKEWWTSGTRVDLEKLLASPVAKLALFLTARGLVESAAGGLKEVARGKALEALKSATGESKATAAGGGAAATVAATLGVTDVDALLNKVFGGIALAIQRRAEAEAVDFVLREVKDGLCGTTVGGVTTREILRNTCTLADQEVFGGAGQPGGLASLDVLRRALREDLLALPAFVARKVVAAEYPLLAGTSTPFGSKVEELVGQAVGALVQGAAPLRVAEQFASGLVATVGSGADPESQHLKALALAVGAPPAAYRAWTQVEDATRNLGGGGTRFSDRERAAVVVLLLLREKTFGEVVEALSGKKQAAVLESSEEWARLVLEQVPHALRAADTIARAAADLAEAVQRSAKAQPGSDAASEALLAAAGALDKVDSEPARVEAARLRAKASEAADAVGRARAGAAAVGRLIAVVDAAVAGAESALALVPEDAKWNQLRVALTRARGILAKASELQGLATAALGADLQGVFQALVRHVGEKEKCPAGFGCIQLAPGALKWAGLAVTLAQAKDANEVSEALLAAAAPVGSYRLKYRPELRWRPLVSLGGLLAYRLDEVKGDNKRFGPPALGVPVGIDLAWPFCKHWHAALFVQALDLGNYLDFGGAGNPSPRPLQAVSLGGFVRLGLFGSPATVAVGGAYDLDGGGRTPDNGDPPEGRWRFTVAVGIDVPLFMLSR